MKLTTFGDSFTAAATFSGQDFGPWIGMLQHGPFHHELKHNFASGGAVSGGATDYAYEIDGEILRTKGVLGQIEDYITDGVDSDSHVIMVGTNDILLSAQLDPFTTAAGNIVTASPLVTGFRAAYLPDHTDIQYMEFIIHSYLAKNIKTGINKLQQAGAENIVVVGYFNLQDTPLLANASEEKANRVALASVEAMMAVKQVCLNQHVYFVDIFDVPLQPFDEVHPNGQTNFALMNRIRQANSSPFSSNT